MMQKILQNNQTKGFLFFFLVMLLSVLSDLSMKQLGAREFPALFIIWVRMAGTFIVLSWFFIPKLKYSLKSNKIFAQFIRALILIVSAIFATTSLKHLPFSYYAMITQLVPVAIALGGILFLHENFNIKIIFSLIVSLCGAILIITQSHQQFNLNNNLVLLLPLGVIICFASFSVMTRWLANSVDNTYILSNFFLFTTIISSILVIWHWKTPSLNDLPWLCALIITNLGIQFCVTKAYFYVKASTLAPFGYFQIVMALLVSYIFLGESITVIEILGSILIIFGGLIVLKK